MDESFACECGCQKFWVFPDRNKPICRCNKCYTEYIYTSREQNNYNWYVRRFNKNTNKYGSWDLYKLKDDSSLHGFIKAMHEADFPIVIELKYELHIWCFGRDYDKIRKLVYDKLPDGINYTISFVSDACGNKKWHLINYVKENYGE